MIYTISIYFDFYIALCREYKKILDKLYDIEYLKITNKEEEKTYKKFGDYHKSDEWRFIAMFLKKNINDLSLCDKNDKNKKIINEFISNYLHVRNLIWHNGFSIIKEKENFKNLFANFKQISELVNKKYKKQIIENEEIEFICEYLKKFFPDYEIKEKNYDNNHLESFEEEIEENADFVDNLEDELNQIE
jgi:hypothetical protein